MGHLALVVLAPKQPVATLQWMLEAELGHHGSSVP
jgi:hypothetical protein